MSLSRNRALSIAAKVGLGAKELSKQCDDRLFSSLASSVHPWRLVFSSLLSEIDVDDVHRENSSEGEKRVAALRKWKERKGHEATYGVLVIAVLDQGKVDQAEALCQLLALQPQTEQAPTESSSIQRSPLPPHPSPTPPLSSTTPATETLSPIATSLEEKIKRLDEEYTKIERLVLETIRLRKVPHKTMLGWIQVLPMTLKSQFSELLRRDAKALSNASNVDELFIIISPYWNSLHPTLLSHLVENLADEKLTSRMKKYTDDLFEFRIHTRLGDLIEKWAGAHGVPPGCNEFALKFGEKWAEKTVEDFEQFRICLSRQKCIGGHMTYMKNVTKGCIFVELALPQCCFPLTLDRDMEKFLKEEDVLGVYVDGLCILDPYQPETMSARKTVKMGEDLVGFIDVEKALKDHYDGWKLKILVCGKTGTGKSTLLNTILGRNLFKIGGPGEIDRFAFKAVTRYMTPVYASIQNTRLEIFDSPGLQDGTEDVEDYLEEMHKKCENINLALYCIDMTTTRWTPQEVEATNLLTKRFGAQFWKKAVLVLTKANMVKPSSPDIEDKTFCKIAYDNFVKMFQAQLMKQNVPEDIASSIPAVAAGSYSDRYLPYVSKAVSDNAEQKYKNFLPELVLTCFERMSDTSRFNFLKETESDYSKRIEVSRDHLQQEQKEYLEKMEQQFEAKEKELQENERRLNQRIAQLNLEKQRKIEEMRRNIEVTYTIRTRHVHHSSGGGGDCCIS